MGLIGAVDKVKQHGSLCVCLQLLPAGVPSSIINTNRAVLTSLPASIFLPYLNETLWNTNPHSNIFLPCLNERLRAESKYPPHDMRTSPPHACRAVTSLSNKHFTTSRACPLAADVLVTPSLTHPPCGLVPVYYHVSLVDFPLPRTRRVPLTGGPGRIGKGSFILVVAKPRPAHAGRFPSYACRFFVINTRPSPASS
jgi:hypothetical protein